MDRYDPYTDKFLRDTLKEERCPCESDYDEGYLSMLDKAIWIMQEWLPSVQPKKEECEEREQGLCPFYVGMEAAQAERKTGKWIYDGDCYICNQCKSAFSWWADSQTSNYCPNCGADMRGEEDETD